MFHVEHRLRRLRQAGILGGLAVGRWFPERRDLQDVVTFCCTEVNDPAAIDFLASELARPAGDGEER